ncbi:YczE/YyaS/YitT family protein [Nocardia sp. CA-290969]|uniref:membrane protein YczE n=1 Tax=Nocardia sp. CA-290969 TaxID=3239986 RepID=UPI003D8D6598
MAVMIRAAVGLGPWNVFHEGVTRHVPMSFGTVTIVTGAVVLLAWIPLRQRPGFGTVSNVVLVGPAVDLGLWLLPHWESLPVRVGAMVLAVALNALAGVLYIGAGFGPGPRDGLMTGLVQRTGLSIRLVRTAIEVAVLVTGWILGGSIGLGTAVYALAIGPLMQALIPLVNGWLPGFETTAPAPNRSSADTRARASEPEGAGCGNTAVRPGP